MRCGQRTFRPDDKEADILVLSLSLAGICAFVALLTMKFICYIGDDQDARTMQY